MRNFCKNAFLLTFIGVMNLISLKAEAALFVAGYGNRGVLRYDEQTGDFIDTFIPTGRGGLQSPSSMALGPDGNLYVGDYDNASVLRYDAQTGDFIDVFVPPASGGIARLENLSFGPDGDLYITGLEGSGVNRYNGQTGAFIETVVTSVPSTGEKLSSPSFIFGPDNDLFVSAVLPTGGVLRYDNDTDRTEVFIPPEESPVRPGGLLYTENLLYVNDFIEDASIRRYDAQTGAFVDTFVPVGSGGLNYASRSIFGPDNNLYVTSQGNDSVLRYDGTTGAFVDAFVSSGEGGLDRPIGLLFAPASLSVPEPTSYLGILGFGAYISARLVLKSKQTKHKSANI